MRLIIFCFLFFIATAEAQQVFYPVESQQAYQAYRYQYRGYRRQVIDPALNLFRQNLAFKTNDSIVEVQIIDAGKTDILFKQPLFGFLYKDKVNFYSFEKKDQYIVKINPILHFESGQDDSGMIWTNKRGLEIKGNIGGFEKGVGFYTMLSENQALLPYPYRYFTDSLNFVPNELFYKKFKNKGAVDYFQARGYITFNAVKNYVKFQFGHDKNKIGNGYRSLILSDYAPQYLFLKINTDVERLHYQNLFTQFTDNGPIMSNVLFGKRYGAFHRLSYEFRPNLIFGVNEMVIFDRIDSTQSNQFDFNYLNPVIFYRSIESNLGSRDNSMIAIDGSWAIRNKYILYGQLVLDEFNLKFLKSSPDWWGNKYAYQLGVRFLDFLKLENLDINLEYNRCRPFTYSHMRPTQSFSHFNQALAHPLGANFAEIITDIRYNYKRWQAHATVIYAKMGRDSALNGRNYGSNILRPYTTRFSDYGSVMYVGKVTELLSANATLSFQIKTGIFADASLNYRKITGSDNLFFSLGLRINSHIKRFDY